MLPTVLALSLLGAPRAVAGADAVTWVPRLDQVVTLSPFLTAAGTRSALLRPEALRGEAHPLLSVDLFDPASLALAGLDPAGELTRSTLGQRSVTCVSVADVPRHRAACDARLARLGTTSVTTVNGVAVTSTRDALDRVLAAYAVAGRTSCAMHGHGNSLADALGLLVGPLASTPKDPRGALLAATRGVVATLRAEGDRRAAVGLTAQGLEARVELRAERLPLGELAGAGASPFGKLAPSGLGVVRARFEKAQVPVLVGPLLRALPPAPNLGAAARAVAGAMTGNVALLVGQVKVRAGLRTREARFFAVRHALLVELSDPAAATAALGLLAPGELVTKDGTLTATVEGDVLVLSNDDEVRAVARAALSGAAGRQGHGLEFEVDPKALARALGQVPLFEAVQAPELAGLVAAGTELGPLLLSSARVHGWLDSTRGGRHAGQLTWALDASRFAADAGVP